MEGLQRLDGVATCYVFFCQDQDELAYPAPHTVLETTSWDQGSGLSSATMIRQMTVVRIR